MRQAHLAKEPCCQACGGTDDLEAHHIRPFHLYPHLELEPANLITLCEHPGHNCHLIFGHLLSWQSFNRTVRDDAAVYRGKLLRRP